MTCDEVTCCYTFACESYPGHGDFCYESPESGTGDHDSPDELVCNSRDDATPDGCAC